MTLRNICGLVLAKKVLFLLVIAATLGRPTEAAAPLAASYILQRMIASVLVNVITTRGMAQKTPVDSTALDATLASASDVFSRLEGSWASLLQRIGVFDGNQMLVGENGSEIVKVEASGNGGFSITEPLPAKTAYRADIDERHFRLPGFRHLSRDSMIIPSALRLGMRVYRGGPCEPSDRLCTLMPELPAILSAKYRRDTANAVLVADSDEHVRQYAAAYWKHFGGGDANSFEIVHNNQGITARRKSDGQEIPFTYVPGGGSIPLENPHLETGKYGLPSRTAKLNPASIANIADKTWRAASAEAGYKGTPYSAAIPISAPEVIGWRAANTATVPAVIDAMRVGRHSIGGRIEVRTDAGSHTDKKNPAGGRDNVNVVNEPNVRVVNEIKIATGEVPTPVAPTLTDPPTAQAILDPLLRMLPGLSAWSVPSHTQSCPRPKFRVFNQTIRMDSLCDIAEQNRAPLHQSMVVVFALVALFVVLSA